MSRTTYLIVFFILLAAVSVAARLWPHIPNFTPVLAVSLLAGAYLPRRLSLLVPLSIMLLSDLVIGGYQLPVMAAVYGSIAALTVSGWYLRRGLTAGRVLWGGLGGALGFFLVTNAAVWQFSGMYSPGLAGLLASYAAGLPFFKYTLLSTVGYSLVLYPLLEVVSGRLYAKDLSWLFSAGLQPARAAVEREIGEIGSGQTGKQDL